VPSLKAGIGPAHYPERHDCAFWRGAPCSKWLQDDNVGQQGQDEVSWMEKSEQDKAT